MTNRIVILGAGPAGVGAAYKLRERKLADVVVLERGERVGGNASSFDWNDHRLDFGSHRLHPASDAAVMADCMALMGEDLLDRPRHGRIRLMGRWLHFPLKPVDLLVHAPPSFAAGALLDAAKKVLPSRAPAVEDFSTVLEAGLGSTICEHFYFPYARKIWGLAPEEMSAIQARKRVSAGSIGKLMRKILSAVPGFKPPGSGRFFYPRGGFGQITQAFADAAVERGADLRLGHSVVGLERGGEGGPNWVVETRCGDTTERFEADQVWSTIPVTLVVQMLRPAVDAALLEASRSVQYRSMVLIYLDLPIPQFTEYDAHYFPGADLRITRLSETKNYAARDVPAGRTALCAELPCQKGDDVWNLSDEDLGKLMVEDLARAGLPVPVEPTAVTARRLPQAYPLYPNGYEVPLEKVRTAVDALPDFLSFGRQGLFAHDNTHHALYMAFSAADCLQGGAFDQARWAEYLEEFSHHVVED